MGILKATVMPIPLISLFTYDLERCTLKNAIDKRDEAQTSAPLKKGGYSYANSPHRLRLPLPRLLVLGAQAFAQSGPSDVPRKETLIVENPEGTIKNAGWFNIWAVNAGGRSTGLQQLAMDTFWYIDPDHGLDGAWDNSLASEPPIYNADFTEMTVKLRPGIFWSDGVEFTADDVVFTVKTHLNTKGLVAERAGPAQRRQRFGS